MIRPFFAVLLAPIITMCFWAWAISVGHISTAGSFGAGLAVAGMLFAASLYVATLIILVPVVLLLRRFALLSFWWVVGISTLIGVAWKLPLDLYFFGFRRAVENVLNYGQRDILWEGGAYAFVLASAFCLIAGIPFRVKSIKTEDEAPA